MTILTKEEKTQIINSHIKTLSYSRFNLEIDDIQEKAKSVSDKKFTDSIALQIQEVDNQIDALNTELTIVKALTE